LLSMRKWLRSVRPSSKNASRCAVKRSLGGCAVTASAGPTAVCAAGGTKGDKSHYLLDLSPLLLLIPVRTSHTTLRDGPCRWR
jgi:hypothetical protein